MKRGLLGIVIPLANEEETVRDLLDRVFSFIYDDSLVFCVFDKSLKDDSMKIVEEYREHVNQRVRLIWAPENKCVVDAYFRGYREAYNSGCDWILEMDGGMSHLPEDIPQFLNYIEEGYEYVGGSRFMVGGSNRSPISRRFISRVGGLLVNLLLKTEMTDMTSGFQCFNRKSMELILLKGVRSKANFFQTEIRYLMSRRKWIEVPIQYKTERKTVGRSSFRESFIILYKMWIEKGK